MSCATFELKSEVQERKILNIKFISTVLGQVYRCGIPFA